MNALELGRKLVAMTNAGQGEEFSDAFSSADIVSVEGDDAEGMPATLEGLEAVKGKAAWWFDNHEVHSVKAEGPYQGLRKDQFVVRFQMDVTPKGGERWQMDELAVYTVANSKVVREEFLYQMP